MFTLEKSEGNTDVFNNPQDLGSNQPGVGLSWYLPVRPQPPRALWVVLDQFMSHCSLPRYNGQTLFNLVPDFELTVNTVIGIFFLFVFVLDNQKNINLGMILGNNKFILLFNRCDDNIAVMWENALSNLTYFFFLKVYFKKNWDNLLRWVCFKILLKK